MKASLIAVAVVAVLVMPAVAFAQSNQSLTRAQVLDRMVQLEKAGYNPAHMNPRTYTDDIRAAEARVAQANAADGSSIDRAEQAGASK